MHVHGRLRHGAISRPEDVPICGSCDCQCEDGRDGFRREWNAKSRSFHATRRRERDVVKEDNGGEPGHARDRHTVPGHRPSNADVTPVLCAWGSVRLSFTNQQRAVPSRSMWGRPPGLVMSRRYEVRTGETKDKLFYVLRVGVSLRGSRASR